MDDIKALEARITDALDRIGVRLAQPAAQGTSVAGLTAQLQEERSANAQLEERVNQLKARQDGHVADIEGRIKEQEAQIAALDAELQLINRALMAEVDGLTSQRSAEAAEVEAILADLKPLLQQEA